MTLEGETPETSSEKIARLEAEVLHWKRIAMKEAGFTQAVIDAVVRPPTPLTAEELAVARELVDRWIADRSRR
jgi:hypothetical protein